MRKSSRRHTRARTPRVGNCSCRGSQVVARPADAIATAFRHKHLANGCWRRAGASRAARRREKARAQSAVMVTSGRTTERRSRSSIVGIDVHFLRRNARDDLRSSSRATTASMWTSGRAASILLALILCADRAAATPSAVSTSTIGDIVDFIHTQGSSLLANVSIPTVTDVLSTFNPADISAIASSTFNSTLLDSYKTKIFNSTVVTIIRDVGKRRSWPKAACFFADCARAHRKRRLCKCHSARAGCERRQSDGQQRQRVGGSR